MLYATVTAHTLFRELHSVTKYSSLIQLCCVCVTPWLCVVSVRYLHVEKAHFRSVEPLSMVPAGSFRKRFYEWKVPRFFKSVTVTVRAKTGLHLGHPGGRRADVSDVSESHFILQVAGKRASRAAGLESGH